MFSFIARHKIISLVVFLNIVVILVVVLIITIHNAKTVTIDIAVAPSEALIELNGSKYDNFTSFDVFPGDCHVKISLDGMQTKEFDLSLADGEFKKIRAYLLDENGGFDYYLENPDEILNLAEVADDEVAQEFVVEYERVAKILKDLPIEYDAYFNNYSEYVYYEIRQDSGANCDKMVCLKIIDYTGGNEQRAKDKIVEMGYNLKDYGISYSYEPIESLGGENE